MNDNSKHTCRTVQEAIDLIISSMTTEEKNDIRDMADDDLIILHLSLGERIRNEWGMDC